MNDQRVGFFGFNPGSSTSPPQYRWKGRLDIDVAREKVADILERWWAVSAWPEAAPFSGGILDAWPSRLADGLAICRSEWAAIQLFLRWEKESERSG